MVAALDDAARAEMLACALAECLYREIRARLELTVKTGRGCNRPTEGGEGDR